MTSSRARFPSLLAGLVVVTPLMGACNFIFNPANSDDVIRCKNTTECEKEEAFADALNTKRLDASCAAPGGSASFTSSKENQVCSIVDRASVSCQTENLPTSDFATAVEEAMANAEVYAACPTDKKGSLGCAEKTGGGCDSGLEVNDFGLCDDGEGLPLYPAANADLALQDIRDQHCRSFFCDESFVCNQGKCSRCDPDLGIDNVGKGACGELAVATGRSPVYLPQSELKDACPDTSIAEKTKFGPVAVAP